MARKFTYDEVKDFIEVESGSGCKLLSEDYVNSQSKIKLTCVCGDDFITTYSQFKNRNKQTCNSCSLMRSTKRQTFSYSYVCGIFKSEGYTVLSKNYVNSHTNLEVMCPHNHIYSVRFSNFQTGHRCPICMGIKNGIRQAHSIEYVRRYLSKYRYKLLSKKYTNSSELLKVECPYGHIYSVNFSNFKDLGRRCPYCSGRIISYDYIKAYIKAEGYSLLSDTYINNSTKLDIKCDNAHRFQMTWGNFQTGYRCPTCSSSKGELKIAKLLTDENIEYIPQFNFKEDNMARYKYDFAIFKNNNIIFIVEYDGIQHFEPVEFFGGDEQFDSQQHNDNIKDQYCKDNNIPLLRIPYWEFDNIEERLEEWLTKNGILQDKEEIV